MKNKSLLMTITIWMYAMSSIAQVKDTFTDSRDGNIYKTVKIGSQTWMAENLAFKANHECKSFKSKESNLTTYGYLYNWKTAKMACPSGWHLPTDAEWTSLTTFLGGDSVSGGKLKESGLDHWSDPNTEATNESGFGALPGGYRSNGGEFYDMGGYGDWWSATEINATNAWYRFLFYNFGNVYKGSFFNKNYEFSVRCLRDK